MKAKFLTKLLFRLYRRKARNVKKALTAYLGDNYPVFNLRVKAL